jgi:hypothetical protein
LDASYVVNFDEYEILANKILKKQPRKPITVFIDMPDVKKAFSKVSIATFYAYYYIILPFIPQKKNGLFLASNDEDGDGPGGNDTDVDEVSIGLSLHLRRH